MVVVDLGILKVMLVVWGRRKMVVLLELIGMKRELGEMGGHQSGGLGAVCFA